MMHDAAAAISSRSFPRFDCPECGRSIASEYRDAIHVTRAANGRWVHYAPLRPHHRPDGAPCSASHTGPLARVLM